MKDIIYTIVFLQIVLDINKKQINNKTTTTKNREKKKKKVFDCFYKMRSMLHLIYNFNAYELPYMSTECSRRHHLYI
jgi:hypothetical protein